MGIRDHLRAWQEQHNAGLEVAMPYGFPDSKSESQLNILAQSGTSDGNNSLFRDDGSSENDFALEVDAENQVTDVSDHQSFLRKGDLVELL